MNPSSRFSTFFAAVSAAVLLATTLTLPVQATVMQVTGSFSGAPKSGATTRSLSGGFTAQFDNALIAPTGNFVFDNLSPTTFFLNDPLIGNTTFDLSNTFLDLGFNNGNLRYFILGDVSNNTTSPGTDDFNAYFENNGSFLLSQVVVVDTVTGFFGTDFRFNDASAGSFSVAVAPPPPSVSDSASTLLLATLGCLGILTFRRRRAPRVQCGS